MPQVDLETLVTACAGGGSDRKIACEPLADDNPEDEKPEDDDTAGFVPPHVEVPDFPPESFWLSKDAEFDWFDRNAFFERKESTRGANSNSMNLNPNLNPGSNSNSQRFSLNLKSKAAIIGLPKTQKASYVDSKRRTCKPANIRLFPPKRTESVGKATGMTEPSSPKVSCMGRVRSKRGRRRSSRSGSKREKPLEKSRSGRDDKRKPGFCSRVMSIFRSSRRHKKTVQMGSRRVQEESRSEEQPLPPRRNSTTVKVREIPVSIEPAAEPPGLGGMKRFASGRKSESWTAEEINAAISESLGSQRRVGST